MKIRRHRWAAATVLSLALLAAGAPVSAAPPEPAPTAPAGADPPGVEPPPAIAPDQRDRVLPGGWRASADRAWTTAGDADGFHVLTATAASGYAWRTAATLAEPGFDTDQWIGNACLTGAGRKLVVAYAPRTFTNKIDLYDRGAFTAVVDLADGTVTKLPVQSTLAYFNPGCGAGDTAVVTQYAGERADHPGGRAQTRLTTIDAAKGRIAARTVVGGEVSSAVPAGQAIVAAGNGRLLRIRPDGTTQRLADTAGVPFRLVPDRAGAVLFMDRTGDQVRVRRTLPRPGAAASTVATGGVTQVGLTAAAGGQAVLTGQAQRAGTLPATVRMADVPPGSVVSTDAGFAVTRVTRAATSPTSTQAANPVRIEGRVLGTGATVSFAVHPNDGPDPAAGRAAHPSLSRLPSAKARLAAGVATEPVEAERYCSVPRNDPRNQALQPKPRQVEWAVDQAITKSLTVQRPANWKNLGMPAYTPQEYFPPVDLAGGGRVPAQIMLGIIAQESNMWQAPRFVLPGVTGNPLIGNFYGRPVSNSSSADDWDIHWDKADCGYGVAQITDGMRLAGHEKPGETSLPYFKQRAVALDFATNVAAGVQILQQKWNEVYRAGMRVHDGYPGDLENWFFAIWAYNSGFYPDKGDGQPWGVGWGNNPINPKYDPQRTPFLDAGSEDARVPQKWPYQEKVLGWAGHPVEINESATTLVAGYRQAWWTGVTEKSKVKPDPALFCTMAANTCSPGAQQQPTEPGVSDDPPGPCLHRNTAGQFDLRCWFHDSVAWKPTEEGRCSTCGHEVLRFDPGYAYQEDGTSYPAACTTDGLPAGVSIIDDVPNGMPVVRGGCTAPASTGGTFGLRFAADGSGAYPSKVDFHQLGGGFGGHFWMGYTHKEGDQGNRMKVTGTWTINPTNAWTRVLVHLPSHATHSRQADYQVYLPGQTEPTKHRTVPTRWEKHTWLDIGVFDFRGAGTPKIELSNVAADGSGIHRISWDAIAVQPLAAKPKHSIVAMGDSFSAGEGAESYTRVSDQYGNDPEFKNACRRTSLAWGPQVVLPGTPSGRNLDHLRATHDANVDFQHIACAGARTHNVMSTTNLDGSVAPKNAAGETPRGTQGEATQLDSGFVEENTTLVMLSIGGNDAGWHDVLEGCLYHDCLAATFGVKNYPAPLTTSVPARIGDVVKRDVNRVVKEIRERAPNAWIVLVGYPRLLREGSSLSVPLPTGTVLGLPETEVRWLNDMARVAATELLPADMDHKVAAIDVRTDFDGHEVGWGFDNWINSYELGDNYMPDDDDGEADDSVIGAGSFHPNVDGYRAYTRAVNDLLPIMNYTWN